MSECDKNEVYPSKLAKMSEFRHIFSRATLWVDIAFIFHATNIVYIKRVEQRNWLNNKRIFDLYRLNDGTFSISPVQNPFHR